MTIQYNEHFAIFESSDSEGQFTIEVQYDLTQIRVTSEDGDSKSTINVDRCEVQNIANMLIQLLKRVTIYDIYQRGFRNTDGALYKEGFFGCIHYYNRTFWHSDGEKTLCEIPDIDTLDKLIAEHIKA